MPHIQPKPRKTLGFLPLLLIKPSCTCKVIYHCHSGKAKPLRVEMVAQKVKTFPRFVSRKRTSASVGFQDIQSKTLNFWVWSCLLVFAYITFLAFPAVIRSQGGFFLLSRTGWHCQIVHQSPSKNLLKHEQGTRWLSENYPRLI